MLKREKKRDKFLGEGNIHEITITLKIHTHII